MPAGFRQLLDVAVRAWPHVKAGNIARAHVQNVLLPHLRGQLLCGSFLGAVDNFFLRRWKSVHVTAAQGPVQCAQLATRLRCSILQVPSVVSAQAISAAVLECRLNRQLNWKKGLTSFSASGLLSLKLVPQLFDECVQAAIAYEN